MNLGAYRPPGDHAVTPRLSVSEPERVPVLLALARRRRKGIGIWEEELGFLSLHLNPKEKMEW